MKVYHYHPSGLIFLKGNFPINYMETASNFAIDYGQAGYIPTTPYDEVIYDLDDTGNRFLINEGTGLKDLIETPITEIENIINAYDSVIAGQELRNNPPPTLAEAKELKILELKNEGVSRMVSRVAGVLTFDQVNVMKEQWLSIDLGSRNPTPDFQFLIDVWQAGQDAAETINAYTLQSEIDAYNITTDPVWP